MDYGKMLMNNNPQKQRGMLEHRIKKLPSFEFYIDIQAYCSSTLSGMAKPRFLLDHEIIDLGETMLNTS